MLPVKNASIFAMSVCLYSCVSKNVCEYHNHAEEELNQL